MINIVDEHIMYKDVTGDDNNISGRGENGDI